MDTKKIITPMNIYYLISSIILTLFFIVSFLKLYVWQIGTLMALFFLLGVDTGMRIKEK